MTSIYRSSSPPESFEGYGGYNTPAMTHTRRSSSIQLRTKRTWDGVFLPVSLSVFGVVLFLRLPWIVGQCGLWLSYIAIIVCFTVTLLTTISLAAISTNGFTGDGGPYMMITRCLGPQIGTTVGLTFCLANLVASAMYLAGGAQVVADIFGGVARQGLTEQHYWTTVACSSVMLLFLLIISFLKIEKFFRTICLVLTLTSVLNVVITALGGTRAPNPTFTGITSETWRANWNPDFDSGNNFASALSILFPGVSGLMSGVCLSGDLKHGDKAIPRGIGYAWILSLVTYLVMATVIAGSFDREILKGNYRSLRYGSYEPLFLPGEFCASFAAVLAMMIGSSRVLRAIGRDKLLPWKWVHFIGARSPREVAIMFYVLIQTLLFTGDSYTIASAFATQVFCANFLALNLSTFLSAVTGVASFRPVYSFFNSITALIGAFLCVALMFYISPLVSTLVIVFMFLLLTLCDAYIDSLKLYWGDASQPLFFYLVRKWLLRLDERKEHVRHWRPSFIHVVTDPLCSMNLMHLCNNLKKGGLYELCMVVQGDFGGTVHACHQWKGWVMDFIYASGIKAFGIVNFGSTLRAGVQNVLRTAGLGGMRPNAVLLSLDEILQREAFLLIYKSYQGNAANLNASRTDIGTSKAFGVVRPLKDVHLNRSEFFGQDSLARLRGKSTCDRDEEDEDYQHPPSKNDETRPFLPATNNASPTTSLASYTGSAGPSPQLSQQQQQQSGYSTRVGEREPLLTPVSMQFIQHSRVGFQAGGSSGKIAATAGESDGDDDLGPLDETFVCGQNLNSDSDGVSDGDGAQDPASPVKSKNDKKKAPLETACAPPSATAGSNAPASEGKGVRGASIVEQGKQVLKNWSAWLHSSQHGLHEVGDDAAEQQQPQQQLGTVGYRTHTKKQARWGLFRTSRGEANEDAESVLVERMVSHRHMAIATAEPDLASYSDITEFCDMCKDVAAQRMNLVLARNMDKLDKNAMTRQQHQEKGGGSTNSNEKYFVDIWTAEESDVITFLMAHCLSLTSVWKTHSILRVVQIVSYNTEISEHHDEWRRILKTHRIQASVLVLSLESEAARLGKPLDSIIEQYDSNEHRSAVLNAMIQAQCEANGHRTALVMMRVDPYHGGDTDDEAAESWFSDLVDLTSNLPPTLLISGGSINSRSVDW